MKYDDASWHYGGDFPKDLPQEAGATHIGMFLAWALLSGLEGDLYTEELPDAIPSLQSRSITPGAFLIANCDEKFTDDDLNEEGNDFAQGYYASDAALYVSDYGDTLGEGLESLYHVKDTWENFDRIKLVLDQRFKDWKNENSAPTA